jgi:hypothetical protein
MGASNARYWRSNTRVIFIALLLGRLVPLMSKTGPVGMGYASCRFATRDLKEQ